MSTVSYDILLWGKPEQYIREADCGISFFRLNPVVGHFTRIPYPNMSLVSRTLYRKFLSSKVMATYVENEDEEMMDISEREGVEGEERSREETGDAGLVERIQLLWWILRPRGSPLKRPLALIKVHHSSL